MAQTYYFNNGGLCDSVQATLTVTQGCTFINRTTQWNGAYSEIWELKLNISLNAAATQNLTVWYSLDWTEDTDYGGYSEGTTEYSTVFTAGQTTKDITITCYTEIYEDYGSGGWMYEVFTKDNPILLAQKVIPEVCLVVPVECDLEIYSGITTNPVLRGETGSIKIFLSGATGSTIEYKVNGAVITSSGSATGYTFSNLLAGTYTVLATEGECFSQKTYTILDGEFRTAPFTLNTIKDLTCTENPIILNLSTGVNLVTRSGSGESTLEVTSTIVDGDYIEIQLEYPQTYVARFTAKNFPVRDDYFLATTLKNDEGVSVGTNSSAEIAKSIEEVLSKDILLSRLYDFRTDSNIVYIKAKEQNAYLNLNTSRVTIVGNITLTETRIGVSAYDGQLSQNYSLYTTIYVNEDIEYGEAETIDEFTKVAELELPFSSNNKHFFDLAPVLKNFVSTPKLNFNVKEFTTLSPMISSYYLEYGEKYPLVQNSTTKKSRKKGVTGQKYCINSSLPWTDANDMSAYLGTGSTSPTGYTTNVKFLTTAPSVKQVQRNSSEYLFFILPKDYGKTLSVKGDLYFYDGTILTGETLYTISTGSTNFGGVFCCAAGYNELNLADYEVLTGDSTRKIRRVDFAVWQSDSANTLTYTETRSFRYEIDELPRRYGCAFLNSLGTWDIFDFSGEIIDDVEYSNDRIEIPREVNTLGSSPAGFIANSVYNTRVTKKIACNTGWIDMQTFDWLIDLLASNRIYNYTDSNQPYLIVDSVNYQASSNDDLYNIDVVFQETLHLNNISI